MASPASSTPSPRPRRRSQSASLPPDWPLIRQTVLKRDGYQCVRQLPDCTTHLHVHHVLPRHSGGDHHLSNLVTLCDRCHASRHLLMQASLARRFLEAASTWLQGLRHTFLGGTSAVNLYPLLRLLTGRSDFMEGQQEAIRAVLAGHDLLVIRPTGSGKSVIYQLPALLSARPSLVISPLKALMLDQVQALWQQGIPASFLNSDLSAHEKRERVALYEQGAFPLLYMAPERLDQAGVASPAELQRLQQIPIQYLVIDEAHTIDEWGWAFRPSYRRLGDLRRRLGNPQIIAVTATATPAVRNEIIRTLELKQPLVLLQGFDRPNITLHMEQLSTNQGDEFSAKLAYLVKLLNALGPEVKSLIFVPTIRIGKELSAALDAQQLPTPFYFAGLEPPAKQYLQDRFANQSPPPLFRLIATKAFGLGIDIPDIRVVIHWSQPASINSYFQEIGRSGRDGRAALAILLKYPRDAGLVRFMLRKSFAGSELGQEQADAQLQAQLDECEQMHRLSQTEGCIRAAIAEYFEAPIASNPRTVRQWLWHLLTRRSHLTHSPCCTYCARLRRPQQFQRLILRIRRAASTR
jgi:ATP-dependent DNA helicase RecQ